MRAPSPAAALPRLRALALAWLWVLGAAAWGCAPEAPTALPTPDPTPVVTPAPSPVLLLGFEAFGSFDPNPTEALVARLAAGRGDATSAILPVDPDEALTELHTHLAAGHRLVFALGVRDGIARLQLNTAGLNWMTLADATGASRFGPVDTTLPVEVLMDPAEREALTASLQAAGVDFEASDDAGLHVCNAVVLHGLTHAPTGTRFVFMHVPPTLAPAAEAALARAIDALARDGR